MKNYPEPFKRRKIRINNMLCSNYGMIETVYRRNIPGGFEEANENYARGFNEAIKEMKRKVRRGDEKATDSSSR